MLLSDKPRLMIVDDERYICEIVVETLLSEKYDVVSFSDPRQAVNYLRDNSVDLILTDLVMGDMSGVDILETAQATQGDPVVVLMTAYPTVQTAISVLKKGVYDLLIKPFKLDVVKATVKRGLEHQRILRENVNLKGQVEFLKATSGLGVGFDHERCLEMVLDSCKTELRAAAAGLIEIDPKTNRPVHKLFNPNNCDNVDIVLDESLLEKFASDQVTDPIIKSDKLNGSNGNMTKTLVTCPIYIRKRLHGLINVLMIDRFPRLHPGQMDVLTILTSVAGSAIANEKLYQNVRNSFLQAISALASAVEARDKYTKGHTDRVLKLAEKVALHLGWNKREMETMMVGCMLHDIGKIGVPDCILNKPDQFTDEERRIMMQHPSVGLKIASEIELFKPAIPYIISHHERYDGNGYPKGLKGDEIPVEGRLLAVVDTFDAIMSDRPYRKGASIERAVDELLSNRNTQFDPDLVKVFIEVLQMKSIDFKDLYGRDFDVSFIDSIPITETVRV
jgi:putative nucleotidyltransferase with HDIG domain